MAERNYQEELELLQKYDHRYDKLTKNSRFKDFEGIVIDGVFRDGKSYGTTAAFKGDFTVKTVGKFINSLEKLVKNPSK